MQRLAWFVVAALAAGCGGKTAEPRPQWRVTVATDAPVHQFGDRLLVEVLDENGELACRAGDTPIPGAVGCRRVFGAGDQSFWPASFGVVANEPERPLRIRVRLYRSGYIGQDGLPAGRSLIEYVGKLPAVDGVTPAYVELRMRCFGIASAIDQGMTCDPASGLSSAERVVGPPPTSLPQPASWPEASERPCAVPVPEGMACVPGGAFLLGEYGAVEALDGLGTTPERLVALSPFALDRDEINVGEVRDLVAAGQLSATPTLQDPTSSSKNHACTYYDGPRDSARDALPVNCVTRALAREICESTGRRLPTEAEWEYTAGNRGLETTYAWGDTPSDLCLRTVIAVGRTDIQVAGGVFEDVSCRGERPDISQSGPVAGGAEGDVTFDGIRNLAGNVSEWIADENAEFDDPCWQPEQQLLVDPVCNTPPPDSLPGSAVRGGNWASFRSYARTSLRMAAQSSPYVGVRCAKSL